MSVERRIEAIGAYESPEDFVAVSPDIKLAALSAVFVLYLIGFFIVGKAETFRWFPALTDTFTLVLCVLAALRQQRIMRPFFILLAIVFVGQASSWIAYMFETTIENASWWPLFSTILVDTPLWMVCSTMFYFFWSCAWGLLAIQLLKDAQSTRFVTGASLFIFAGLAVVFAINFRNSNPAEVASRFELVIADLQLTGLIFGLTTVLLGAHLSYILMVVGFSLYAATDFIFFAKDFLFTGQPPSNFLLATLPPIGATWIHSVSEVVEPIWTLALMMILGGVLISPSLTGTHSSREQLPVIDSLPRSGMSSLLLLVSLGSVFFTALIFVVFHNHQIAWLSFFFLLFSVACVIVITRMTAHFDRAIDYTRQWSERLLTQRLRTDPWLQCDPVTRRTLEATGLGNVLQAIEDAAE